MTLVKEKKDFMKTVRTLTLAMIGSGSRDSYPNKSEGEFFDKDIEKISIHDNGNVEICLINHSSPVILSSFADALIQECNQRRLIFTVWSA